MLVGSAERIAWFQKLRRIYEFSVHPTAPGLKGYPRKRFGDFASDSSEYSAGPTSLWVSPHSALQRLQPSIAQGIEDGNARPADFSKGLLSPAPMSQHGSPFAVYAAQQYGALNRPVSDKSSPGPHIAVPATIEAGPLDERQARPSIAAATVGRFRTGVALPSASPNGSSEIGGFPGPDPWRPPVAGDHTTSPPRDRIIGTSHSKAESDHGLKGEDGFTFRGSSQPVGKDDGASHTPRSFTLHLDGSTLGRWTVDHLQRTLSRPATGMTGVDPRSVVPRSRVSPF